MVNSLVKRHRVVIVVLALMVDLWGRFIGFSVDVPLNESRIYSIGGYAYAYVLVPPAGLFFVADDDNNRTQSQALLYEDGNQLYPPHAVHKVIIEYGGGRWSHWQGKLVFSSFDNSDPTGNGHAYLAKLPAYFQWWALVGVAAAGLALGWLVGLLPAFARWSRRSVATYRQTLLVVTVNIGAVVALLGGIELYFRVMVPEPQVYREGGPQPGQYFRFAPYLQTVNEGPLDTHGLWIDKINDKKIPFYVKSNNLGFRVPFDFNFSTHYRKAPNEKVVLIFGGSAVYGFGNTSNETTVAGRIQKFLNATQNKIKYTVFNMGNGGWVAYQEFVALDLYGLNLEPDWVIVMDGRNDNFAFTTVSGEDIGAPFSTTTIRSYIDGNLYRQDRPEFFRSTFENQLLTVSRAYRMLTGEKPVTSAIQGPYPTRKWSDIEGLLDFYKHTLTSMLNVCPSCRFILSTQPIYRSAANPSWAARWSSLDSLSRVR